MRKQNACIAMLLVFVSSLFTATMAGLYGCQAMVVVVLMLVHVALEGSIVVICLSWVPDEEQPAAEDRIDEICREFGLSAREREVMESYSSCRDIRSCANELFISPGTVKSHLSHIYGKTGVGGSNELLRLCESYPVRD